MSKPVVPSEILPPEKYDYVDYIERAQEAMAEATKNYFTVGACLIAIKEKEPHGKFIKAVEQHLGMTRMTANNIMRVTERFSNIKPVLHLEASKLYALLPASDEEVEKITKSCNLHRMSKRQIIEKVREVRGSKPKAQQTSQLESLSNRIIHLMRQLVSHTLTPSERSEAKVFLDAITDEYSLVRAKLDVGRRKSRPARDQLKESRERIVGRLNILAGTNYQPHATSNRRHLDARLQDGLTEEEALEIVEMKVEEWKGTEHEMYLRPETLFNATKCESYRGRLPAWRREKSQPRRPDHPDMV